MASYQLVVYPTTYSEDVGTFSNPGGAYTNNGVLATTPTLGRSGVASIYYSGFGTSSIPSTATITAVDVVVGAKKDSSSTTFTMSTQIYAGSLAFGTATNSTLTTTLAEYVGASYALGLSSIPTLRVKVGFTQTSTKYSGTASLDYVKVTITYDAPDAPVISGVSFTKSGIQTVDSQFSCAAGTSYNIMYGTTSPPTNVAISSKVPDNGTAYNTIHLTEGYTYYLQIKATNSSNISSTSSIFTVDLPYVAIQATHSVTPSDDSLSITFSFNKTPADYLLFIRMIGASDFDWKTITTFTFAPNLLDATVNVDGLRSNCSYEWYGSFSDTAGYGISYNDSGRNYISSTLYSANIPTLSFVTKIIRYNEVDFYVSTTDPIQDMVIYYKEQGSTDNYVTANVSLFIPATEPKTITLTHLKSGITYDAYLQAFTADSGVPGITSVISFATSIPTTLAELKNTLYNFEDGVIGGVPPTVSSVDTLFHIADDETGSNGTKVLMSGNSHVNNSSSGIKFEFNIAELYYVYFDYYISSESSFDWFTIYFDETMIAQISGTASDTNVGVNNTSNIMYAELWSSFDYPQQITGSHSLTLIYTKDGSTEAGWDNVYIDNVGYSVISTGISMYNIEVTDVTTSSAIVHVRLDGGYGTLEIDYGTTVGLGLSVNTSYMYDTFDIQLSDLSPGTTYYFQTVCMDAINQISTDNNGGSYYTFTTSSDSSTPTVSIVSHTKDRISAQTGMDISTVVFTVNCDITEWEARADGAGVGQGLLVGSGVGTISANTNISFDVEDQELTSGDKSYRINVYARNQSGVWNNYG